MRPIWVSFCRAGKMAVSHNMHCILKIAISKLHITGIYIHTAYCILHYAYCSVLQYSCESSNIRAVLVTILPAQSTIIQSTCAISILQNPNPQNVSIMQAVKNLSPRDIFSVRDPLHYRLSRHLLLIE